MSLTILALPGLYTVLPWQHILSFLSHTECPHLILMPSQECEYILPLCAKGELGRGKLHWVPDRGGRELAAVRAQWPGAHCGWFCHRHVRGIRPRARTTNPQKD